MEELRALQHELDSWKCCTHGIRGECILVTKPVVCNKALSRFGFSLAETDPDVLTLFLTDNEALYSQNDDDIAFVEIVLRLIREHESIKCFCFRRVHINILGPILGSLAARSDVRELILNDIRYRGGDYADTQPYGGIATFPSTTEDYEIGTPTGTAAVILKVVRQAQSLEVVEFKEGVTHASIHADVHADVAIELGRELAKKRSLKTLTLGPCCRDIFLSYVSTLDAMQPADKVCNLKSVTLCGDIYHDRSCDSLLSNASITYLDLSGCGYVSNSMGCSGRLIDPYIQELANMLSRNSSVKVLILQNEGFRQEGAEALGRLMVSNTTIRTLDISGNALGTSECTALAGGLRMARGLREVIMKGCHITHTGAMAMYEALRENQFNISVVFGTSFTLTKRMLELEILVTRPRRIFRRNSDEMVDGSNLLMQPQHFKEITLEWNNGNYFPLDKFCTFLQQDGVLVESMSLDLSNLSRDLVQQLAGCLQRRKGIQALSVYNYGETDEGVLEMLQLLAQGLQKNTSLSALELHIQVSDVIHLFADVISKNKALQSIHIGRPLKSSAVHELEQRMMRNYAITKFQLHILNDRVGMETLTERNRVLQDRSLHFMSQDTVVKKRWVEAFELTHDTGTFRRAILSKLKISEEQAHSLIVSKQRYIRDHYFEITAVSKDRIVCNASSTGAAQMDSLSAECLSHIAGYLSVSDVV